MNRRKPVWRQEASSEGAAELSSSKGLHLGSTVSTKDLPSTPIPACDSATEACAVVVAH